MKVVSFIPIKLNNQRLPGKNLMLLNKRPLCDYIFNTIINVSLLDENYVYCSDERIKEYLPHGIEYLKRDSCLDSPDTKGTDIIASFLKDIEADIYLITHVTQPFTKIDSLEFALRKVISEGYDSAFSAVELQDYCWYQGKPVNYDINNLVPTQQLEPVYMETGAFYIFKREVFESSQRRIGDNPYMYIVDRFEAIDIDTREDFNIAEAAALFLETGNERVL